nr:cytokine receptor family member B12 [Megalobrama amblycephala]
MTCFLLTCMFTLLQIFLAPSKAMLFPPKNLTVGLLDFNATAEWLPGQGNPPGTKYTLEYTTVQNMSGGKWIPSPNCTNIAILKCELTFDELHWHYFVRVKTTFKGMNSNWTTTSKSFQPYGDTRLSSPDVEISSDQKSIKINFSHRLELKPEIKLEFLLYLFEKSPAGESEFIPPISTSESPYIVPNVPSGKNYCVSVSASHQQASKNNNFSTTKCTFLLDSTRSFVLLVCIVAILLIAFSTGIVVTFGCFYDMRFKIKNLHIPKALIFIKINNRVIEQTPEELQTITVTLPVNTEDYDSALEEEYGYHKRENITNVIINPSSIANVNPPEQSEEAETSNQCLYTLATDLEQSQESEICEKDNDDIHPVTPASLCTCTSNHSESSTFLQATTVNVFVNSEEDRYYAKETPFSSINDCEREVPAEEKEEEKEEEKDEEEEEEEDVLLLADHSSESGYEPRHAINDL